VTKGRRVAAWLLLAAALGLAILGQWYFSWRREYVWDGVVFHLLAAICFLLAWHLSQARASRTRSSRPSQLGAWFRARPLPPVLLAVGVLLSLVASLLARDRPPGQSSYDVVLFWGLGVLAVVLAALWPEAWSPRSLRDWRARLRGIGRATWLELATVATLTLFALVLRVAALERVPYTVGGDEAWHGLLARQVLSGELRSPFRMGYMSMPTGFYWPLSWSLWLVGDDVTGLRLPAALVGAATVPILYFFARDLWGRRTALLSALFLAGYDYHIHYSRLGANNAWDPLFVLLTLWAVDRGLTSLQDRNMAGEHENQEEEWRADVPSLPYRPFLLAGLAMGLSVYFYTGARLLLPLIGLYVGFVWLQKRKGMGGLGLCLVFLALALLVAGGPMLSYAQAHPNEWNARINQVGILQSGWLAREPALTGKSTAQILAEQFLRSAGAFHVFSDRTVWYGADRPLLGFLAGAFAVLGMAWAVAHWRDRRYFLVLIWFWAVIITGGMLTESPPSSQRLVIAIPTVALLVAFGLEQSVALARHLLIFRRSWENVALGLLVAILVAGSIRFYFVEYSPSRRYGGENGETATMIAYYLRDLDGDYQAYLFGAPRIYWSFGTMAFLAPRVQGKDVVEPLSGPPDFVDETTTALTGRGVVFIFLPERVAELAWVQQAFPDGQVQEFYDSGGRLRFTAYRLP
jgi:4-amino-4-deoxy-L-arabinose transferase-like glycosyltransferase